MRAALDFAAELDAFSKNFETKVTRDFARSVLDLAIRTLVKNTPKDRGVLRGSWWIGSPEQSRVFEDNAVLTRARKALATYKVGDQVSIINDQVYASVVDQGEFDPPNPGPSKDPRPGRKGRVLVRGGYSTQAPRGMTDPALETLLDVFYD